VKASFWPLLLLAASPVAAAEQFQLKDGDRVVFVGSTLIEREQRYGYWETALTARYPDSYIIFRNLGWSGDTVFGHARAGFGSTADGFRHLKEHVLSLKPTVIVLGYGTNESFDGQAGLPAFKDGVGKLLEALGPAQARIVFLSPPPQEDLGRPLPDPTEQNKNLRLYRDALKEIASQRQHRFVDLYDLLDLGENGPTPRPLTDNGIHFTAHGYWYSATALERGLGLAPQNWRVEIKSDGTVTTARGTTLDNVQAQPLRFQATDKALPFQLDPAGKYRDSGADRVLRIQGLAPGKYNLRIDGKSVATASAVNWARGVSFHKGPEFEQLDKLRETIVAKNRLYFHRWRPQNETYLFGFRKHEQGQNAREIPQFDPLIENQERKIACLREPCTHTYELKPETQP
jgi:lysophospholipase L1-like esterase